MQVVEVEGENNEDIVVERDHRNNSWTVYARNARDKNITREEFASLFFGRSIMRMNTVGGCVTGELRRVIYTLRRTDEETLLFLAKRKKTMYTKFAENRKSIFGMEDSWKEEEAYA